MTPTAHDFAHQPHTLRLGDLEVVRLGFGAMRLPGPEVWGEPDDPARARDVLRGVVSLGMNLIDSAWFYGPHVANRLIAETLHPYPKDLVIASKLGGRRVPDKGWGPSAVPRSCARGARSICAIFGVMCSTSSTSGTWASGRRCRSWSRSTR
jgi:aryl-alcohol dehydrogenase-like predicted oxidoreductase